jgi:hypothetical protein
MSGCSPPLYGAYHFQKRTLQYTFTQRGAAIENQRQMASPLRQAPNQRTGFDDPNFLEPAHSQDPKCVSNIVSLPSLVTEQM